MSRFSAKRSNKMRWSGLAKTPKGSGKGKYNYREAVICEIANSISGRVVLGKGQAKFDKLRKYYQMAKGKFN